MFSRLRTALLQRFRRNDDDGYQRRAPQYNAGYALAGFGSAAGLSARGRSTQSSWAAYDAPLVAVVVGLLVLGLVMVYSASIALDASPRFPNVHTSTHFLVRQVIALSVALAAAAVAFSIPMQGWQRLAPWAFVGVLALMVLVLIPGLGKGANGAQRWFSLGPLSLQPSELMKIACVLYAADFTVRKQDYMHHFGKGFLPMATVMALIGALLLMQPDLGAFGVIVVISMGVLFLGGVSGRLFGGIGVALASVFLLVIALSPWRRERIFAYLDPWSEEHMYGKAYQLTHSLIAFGRGEWFGVGLGGSVEKLHYLPDAHTDFIFAVIGEELGLIGVIAVIFAFYWLVKRAFEIGRQAVALERTFAGLVAQGVGLWIGVQAFINIGVATGLLPTKGLTLPFISYGGSALLSCLVAIGLLLRVDLENRQLMRGVRA